MILTTSEQKRWSPRTRLMVSRVGAVLLLWAISLPSFGYEIESVDASQISENMALVEVNFQIDFSQDVIEALESSIPITILTRIRIYRKRANLWDKLIHEHEVKDEIIYRSLYRVYRLTGSDHTIDGDYLSLDRILESIGRQRNYQLTLPEGKFDPNENYIGKIRISLDRSSLPSAMRLPVFFKNSWRLQTETARFEIK